MSNLSRTWLVAVSLLVVSGCSGVKKWVRPDWEQVDRQRVKRLVIVTHPNPAGEPKVGEMWSTLAARHVDLQRDFIIKDKLSKGNDEPVDPKSLCTEGVDGVLWMKPDVKRAGKGVEAALQGSLLRCVDGEQVWSAESAGSWDESEEGLKELIGTYSGEFGPEVAPYVPATYHLLRAVLDTLPNPVLTEDEKGEKIENAQ